MSRTGHDTRIAPSVLQIARRGVLRETENHCGLRTGLRRYVVMAEVLGMVLIVTASSLEQMFWLGKDKNCGITCREVRASVRRTCQVLW